MYRVWWVPWWSAWHLCLYICEKWEMSRMWRTDGQWKVGQYSVWAESANAKYEDWSKQSTPGSVLPLAMFNSLRCISWEPEEKSQGALSLVWSTSIQDRYLPFHLQFCGCIRFQPRLQRCKKWCYFPTLVKNMYFVLVCSCSLLQVCTVLPDDHHRGGTEWPTIAQNLRGIFSRHFWVHFCPSYGGSRWILMSRGIRIWIAKVVKSVLISPFLGDWLKVVHNH